MGNWAPYLCKGITNAAAGDKVPIRKDIRDFSEVELYLYVEGLKLFQAVDFKNPLSYFQIAGIHGRPYTAWPAEDWNKTDIPEISPVFDEQYRGFCTHTSILFLPWHRPYLALFERELHKHVNTIAEGITDPSKDQYVAAAKQFRIPYWDWAAVYPDAQIFPKLALDSKYKPNGPPSKAAVTLKPDQQYNPLHHAPLSGAEAFDENIIKGGRGDIFDTTVRYPYNIDNSGRYTNLVDALSAFYKRKQPPTARIAQTAERNLTERVGYLLRSYKRFGPVSNNDFGADSKEEKTAHKEIWGSFEDVHNTIHDLTGGSYGHMASIEASAFDPIFWLHHTNIDRLFAIWQALHETKEKETFVTDQINFAGNFTVVAGDENNKEKIDTPLWPFRDQETSWYTSEKVRRTETFGYAYRETVGLSYPLQVQDPARDTLIQKINSAYPSPAGEILKSKRSIPEAGAGILPQAAILKQIHNQNLTANTEQLHTLASKLPEETRLVEDFSGPPKPYLHKLALDNTFLEWLVNVKAEKHALDGRFSVHLFLDAVQEENVSLWPLSPHHVGTFAPLGQSSSTGCVKCQEDQANHTQVTGQIPLTLALMERYLAGLLDDLSVEKVVPYLTKNLHWRVVKSDGTIAEQRSEVAGLTVFVVSNKVTLPEDESQLPIYDEMVDVHAEITTNLNGGGRGDGTGLTVDEVTPQ